jgi:hypothetical protein
VELAVVVRLGEQAVHVDKAFEASNLSDEVFDAGVDAAKSYVGRQVFGVLGGKA